MINRQEIEGEYRNLLEKYHFGLAAFSPLLGGYLTGKYLDGQGKGRLEESGGQYKNKAAQFRWLHEIDREKVDSILRQLKDLAEKELNTDLTSLAIAWVIKFPYASSAVFGARNIDQLNKCLKAVDVFKRITPEIEGRINKILGTQPSARINFRDGKPEPHLRPITE